MLNLEQRLERDKNIIGDYLKGKAVVRLVAKYGLNSAQIYEILKKNNINPNRYNRPAKDEVK